MHVDLTCPGLIGPRRLKLPERRSSADESGSIEANGPRWATSNDRECFTTPHSGANEASEFDRRANPATNGPMRFVVLLGAHLYDDTTFPNDTGSREQRSPHVRAPCLLKSRRDCFPWKHLVPPQRSLRYSPLSHRERQPRISTSRLHGQAAATPAKNLNARRGRQHRSACLCWKWWITTGDSNSGVSRCFRRLCLLLQPSWQEGTRTSPSVWLDGITREVFHLRSTTRSKRHCVRGTSGLRDWSTLLLHEFALSSTLSKLAIGDGKLS